MSQHSHPQEFAFRSTLGELNYQVGIWKTAHYTWSEFPDPAEGHGWLSKDWIRLEPKWYKGDALSPKLTDVLEQVGDEENDEQESSDTDDDYYSEAEESPYTSDSNSD